MVKDSNREKMGLLTSTLYIHTHFLMKFKNFCKSLIILTRKDAASVLKLVNRQDLKSCGW